MATMPKTEYQYKELVVASGHWSVGQSGALAQANMGSKTIMRINMSITVKLIRL